MGARVLMHCDVDGGLHVAPSSEYEPRTPAFPSQRLEAGLTLFHGTTSRVSSFPTACSKCRLGSKRKVGPVDLEEERARRREKNRIAARESRARKLQSLLNLRTDVSALQTANETLRARIHEVSEQATLAQQHYLDLKGQIEAARPGWGPEEQQLINEFLEQLLLPVVKPTDEPPGVDVKEAEPSISGSDAQAAASPIEQDSFDSPFRGAEQEEPSLQICASDLDKYEGARDCSSTLSPAESSGSREKGARQKAASETPPELLGLTRLPVPLNISPACLLL